MVVFQRMPWASGRALHNPSAGAEVVDTCSTQWPHQHPRPSQRRQVQLRKQSWCGSTASPLRGFRDPGLWQLTETTRPGLVSFAVRQQQTQAR